ncbi:hypothetical protein SLS56_004681 [Neofusicoccum ribis]|uniref:HORMA domain-containing protein n=1 Tax=Neofusicoccum ribis TaxID=45134 RepID=A0ABR3SWH9_9PEZI
MKVKHDGSTQELRLLERNGSFRTNVFMDLLVCVPLSLIYTVLYFHAFLGQQEGAFEAIKKGYLRSMQLKIFKDKDHPENVLETYTWNFGYDRHTGSEHMVTSNLELKGSQGKAVNIKDLTSGLARLVHDFSYLTDKLPKLAFRDSGKLFFKPKLFYTDSAPPDYQPRGWVPGSSSHLNFPRDDDLVKTIMQTGTYHGGYHRSVQRDLRSIEIWRLIFISASVTTSYLQRTGVKLHTIPNDLQYSDRVPATADLMSPSPAPETPQGYHQAISSSFRATPHQDAENSGGILRNEDEQASQNPQNHPVGISDTLKTAYHAATSVSQDDSRDITIHDVVSDHTVSPGRTESSIRTIDRDQTLRKGHRTPNMVSETQSTSQRTERMEIDSQDRLEQEALKGMTIFSLGVGDLPTASEIIRQLQYEKVIVECKKKGYGKNGKPPHQITKTDPGRLRLAKKYFDPLYRVKSYYVLDKQGALTDKSPRTGQKTTPEGNKMSTSTPQTPKRKLDRSPQSILRSPKRIKNSSPEDFNPGFPAYSDDEL